MRALGCGSSGSIRRGGGADGAGVPRCPRSRCSQLLSSIHGFSVSVALGPACHARLTSGAMQLELCTSLCMTSAFPTRRQGTVSRSCGAGVILYIGHYLRKVRHSMAPTGLPYRSRHTARPSTGERWHHDAVTHARQHLTRVVAHRGPPRTPPSTPWPRTARRSRTARTHSNATYASPPTDTWSVYTTVASTVRRTDAVRSRRSSCPTSPRSTSAHGRPGTRRADPASRSPTGSTARRTARPPPCSPWSACWSSSPTPAAGWNWRSRPSTPRAGRDRWRNGCWPCSTGSAWTRPPPARTRRYA